MQFAEKHIQTAEKIISSYDGAVPLHHYLKQFFTADKKYGSKDRKSISHACFCFFRLGNALKDLPVIERIKVGIFLCTDEPGSWRIAFADKWVDHWHKDVNERLQFARRVFDFHPDDIFSLHPHLSNAVEKPRFIISHLIQPDLHLRIRPGREKKVLDSFSDAGLHAERCGEHCVALPNATRIDGIVGLNKDVVVQDRSSQRVASFLREVHRKSSPVKVWDCCAASGGKSILAVDELQQVELTASDLRPTIIQNLKKRFAEAGINQYQSFVADLADPSTRVPQSAFDLVICDAPCSGSGTWSRNPEQLYFFREDKISYYTALQQKIAAKVIPSVAAGGCFLYITCSVFKEENEDVVDFILSKGSLRLLRMELLKGYEDKADTMFAALFIASPL